ncbi:hypothetical protein KY284_003963 [Solanum tuberosum]|nr:hypothetical protein KY284_003963 [Solanum tuberosum]
MIVMMEAMDVRMMVIMEVMIIDMIKSRIGMRANIPEENMRNMVNIALMVKMECTTNLVMAPMVLMEHVRDLTPTPRVKMVPIMVPEHITLPTPRMKVSRSGVYSYTSSIQSHPMGRRECAYLMSKDTTSYTSHVNAHLSEYRNQGRYGGCVRGLGTQRVSLPIFEGKCDPEAYLDWEWQCEQNFQNHDMGDIEQSMYALEYFKGHALSWWKHAGWLRGLNGNTNPLTWGELKWLMRFKYVPKGLLEITLEIKALSIHHGGIMMNGGTRVPNKEPTLEGVMDALLGCPNIPKGVSFQGKEDLSCERQGTKDKLNTFTIANEQSVSDSLFLCEPNASLPCVDNVHVESVDTLVDPIDERIDYSSKIDFSIIEGSCDVIKEPQFGDTSDNVDHLNRSDSLSISFVEDLIACFAHRDHYNILFEEDEITPSDVPSGVNHESSVVLDSYAFYSNPLWCEDCPHKDGNLFLEDESTLLGKDHDEKEGGMCFPITSSSW